MATNYAVAGNAGQKSLGSLKHDYKDFPTRLCGETADILWIAGQDDAEQGVRRRQLGTAGMENGAVDDIAGAKFGRNFLNTPIWVFYFAESVDEWQAKSRAVARVRSNGQGQAPLDKALPSTGEQVPIICSPQGLSPSQS